MTAGHQHLSSVRRSISSCYGRAFPNAGFRSAANLILSKASASSHLTQTILAPKGRWRNSNQLSKHPVQLRCTAKSDRERHVGLINEVRASGARVKLITDGDIFGAIATGWTDAGVDVLLGTGGTPEGVTAAAALKCMGGEMQGMLWPRNDKERQAALDAGYDLDQVLTLDDLVSGEDVFFAATGITDGVLLEGVRFSAEGASTESIVMRASSGTVRRVQGEHRRK